MSLLSIIVIPLISQMLLWATGILVASPGFSLFFGQKDLLLFCLFLVLAMSSKEKEPAAL